MIFNKMYVKTSNICAKSEVRYMWVKVFELKNESEADWITEQYAGRNIFQL